jgi:hypothetical protein
MRVVELIQGLVPRSETAGTEEEGAASLPLTLTLVFLRNALMGWGGVEWRGEEWALVLLLQALEAGPVKGGEGVLAVVLSQNPLPTFL